MSSIENKPADKDENVPPEDDDHEFYGHCCTIRPLQNGQTIRVLWKDKQLQEPLYPGFESTFRELGFDKVDWGDLLWKVAFGGEVALKGLRFINKQHYNASSMYDVFMLSERALVKELLNIVMSKKANIAYMKERISFKQRGVCLKFDPSLAYRHTTLVFQARDECERDAYRIIIEGSGTGLYLYTHTFQFQPSQTWLCQRFPQNVI
jgi:hypothetical protein